VYEVQIHPARIRGKVRYYFLSRRALRWLAVAGVAVVAVVATGVALAPTGARALILFGNLLLARQENRAERAELRRRGETLDALQRSLARARLAQTQLGLVLGVTQDETGIGGFPEPTLEGITDADAFAALARAAQLDTDSRALLVLADELATFAKRHAELARLVPSVCPLPADSFVLTSPYGNRLSPFTRTPDFHCGIDLAAREGTPVRAPGAGRVVFAGRFPVSDVHWWRYGNVVIVAHGERYVTVFAHLRDVKVKRGQEVDRGALLGHVGNTGWSTSPHLHYEVRVAEGPGSDHIPLDSRIFILDYQWKGHEAALVASRHAPKPVYEPLPARTETR